MKPLVGRCHCGAVAVTLPGSAAGVIACHCDDCQRLHGNFFALFAAPADDVAISGAEHLTWYRSGPTAQRAFCRYCGSRIAKLPDGSDRILVSAGLFGPVTGARLRRHLFAPGKPDWYPLPPLE